VVDACLRVQVYVDALNATGERALNYAIRQHRIELVEELLANGSSPSAPNAAGEVRV
jgi:ankyrin repeat protein